MVDLFNYSVLFKVQKRLYEIQEVLKSYFTLTASCHFELGKFIRFQVFSRLMVVVLVTLFGEI